MNIDEFEANLNNFTLEPAKAMAIVLNMCIKHQALLEGLMNSQCMILAHLEGDTNNFKDIHGVFEKDMNERVSELQAQIATLF